MEPSVAGRGKEITSEWGLESKLFSPQEKENWTMGLQIECTVGQPGLAECALLTENVGD